MQLLQQAISPWVVIAPKALNARQERACCCTFKYEKGEHLQLTLLSKYLAHAQDVEIVVRPIPRIVSNWLIGIGRLLSTLIKMKVTILVVPAAYWVPCSTTY